MKDVVRVKKLSVPQGAYRLAVKVQRLPHELYEEEGEWYYLKPAKNRRGKVIERNGQLYRLQKTPPFKFVDIGGEQYMAVPWQRSEDNLDAYEQQSRVELNFDPVKSLYSVLYDKNSGRVFGVTLLGSAVKGTDGKYVDPFVRRAKVMHARGQLAATVDPNFRSRVGDRVDFDAIDEELVELDTNIGYRQGRFPSIVKYLVSKDRLKKLSIYAILDELGGKITDEERAVVEEVLQDSGDDQVPQEQDVQVSAPKKKRKKKKNQVDEYGEDDLAKTFTISEDKGPYKGLFGLSMKILSPSDPQFDHYMDIFSVKDGEILVEVETDKNLHSRRISKVAKESLVEKK